MTDRMEDAATAAVQPPPPQEEHSGAEEAEAGAANMVADGVTSDGAYISHKLLTSSLAIYRPLPLSSTAVAASLPATQGHLAHVLVQRGRWLEHVGHRGPAGRTYLFVEEYTYMMESGALEIVHQGVPLSIQESYALLLDNEGADTPSDTCRPRNLRRRMYCAC
jgi:hypothetical protein